MATTTKKVCAVGIKRLWYNMNPDVVTGDLTADLLTTIMGYTAVKAESSNGAGDAVTEDMLTREVLNVHQDTWQIEETEPSQDSYKNQLTGGVYRYGRKDMGELSFAWTIGQYDYATKSHFLGGTVSSDGLSWKRPRGIVDKKMTLIALTEDDQYCVLPLANIAANEGNTDGAVGVAIKGTATEPENEAVSSEYWFDSSLITLPSA
ncbi:MAG: hypothetical protein LIP02_03910 [Bacteroidales bacterium]|nr:hypothetical protein [Bacteroidales bacterium]